MAGDWIPGFFYGVFAPIAVPPTTGFSGVVPLVGTGLGVDPAGNQVGVPDTDPESVLVHRVVGQIELINFSLDITEVDVDLRFTKGLYSQVTGAVEVFTEDLESGADANESFTHERRVRLFPGQSTLDLEVDPAWAMYDIKSKRTLRAAEFYCIVVNAQSLGGLEGALGFRHYLRAWVTYKG